jgi:hypothetical protein
MSTRLRSEAERVAHASRVSAIGFLVIADFSCGQDQASNGEMFGKMFRRDTETNV